MPRVSPHLVKSLIRLVRQSTTVPNTSNTSAFTIERSDMRTPFFIVLVIPGHAKREPGISRHNLEVPGSMLRIAPERRCVGLIQMEFRELAVLGLDIAHGTGHRAHHHGLGLDH